MQGIRIIMDQIQQRIIHEVLTVLKIKQYLDKDETPIERFINNL